MNLKQLVTDDRAVSPVIGVILMVAITVILAAVIGTFVLGLGSGLNQAPQVQMDFEYDSPDGTVAVTHQGGAELSNSTLSISESDTNTSLSLGTQDTYTAGDTIASGDYDAGETISIVWSSPDGSSSQIIGESTAPSN
ncbi:type IV pilin [Candidatus Halobonum tyrrellensis]|uniref:Archaeal Type IV pilin N-terminal domain-containing protein n=1 Tax=Candidatus Halobonum tyrrellensis G22 TaxID=1324957 RepID=V4IX89_9EURY|nr:type IV pilin N-terminal domain-containing protein [Candidatus Halobonum tyrrellensis]ESP87787.1 hypothetical protein K933_12361 [Candidatus Halobonum tyrrellensis G22]